MTATLKSIFAKPVDRAIDGVIKADDDRSLRLELEEYVLTNELHSHLGKFLSAYNTSGVANGVWISGFFGSGKSHLLKMLALVLENRSIDGTPALDLFIDKCADDAVLAGDLRKAVGIPSKSILFNIDQKADVISKTQLDALLAVFQKVFDEMCGYFGKQGHIAQFERHLDAEGQYQGFKKAFEKHAGKSWERGREQSLLEDKWIALAYAEVSGTDVDAAKGILSRYRSEYKVSIEDYVHQVKDYIDAQEPGFRLNFFIDEVGQYIADNVKLMTNLQTIAETLHTKCKGKAWIIVTAQQDMKSVLGDLTTQQQNDFSKIQARFANRLPLNSKDVAEVIQRRLLSKTSVGQSTLGAVYGDEVNNLRTLFDFSDGSLKLGKFRDEDHFVRSYPFPPYQYDLFQTAIQSLSEHNAFEGKHSSVGERSMLGVFQQVAIHIAELEIGALAPFNLMYEGIRSALTSNVQQSIILAENNLDDEFAIQVLKALFLVKYVKAFKPTFRNIRVLMLNHLNADIGALGKQVEEALNLLEQQTYIQRNGDEYEFLTSEEKDIEAEIKNTEVDTTEISGELNQLIFQSVIKSSKIKHDQTQNEYDFSKLIDDQLMGREHELSINVITPFHDNAGNEEAIRMYGLSKDMLIVVLDQDERFTRDLGMYKRTRKFIQQSRTSSQRPDVELILQKKAELANQRQAELTTRVRVLLGSARLFVRGEEIELGGDDGQARINRAFQSLVDKVHTNLAMLRGKVFKESDIGQHLKQASDGILGSDAAPLTEAEEEVMNFTKINQRNGVRTTIKGVIERFSKKPFGWPYPATLCNIASLYGRGKLEAKTDSNPLEEDAFKRALTNSRQHDQIVLEPQVEYTTGQVSQLKQFYKDFFEDQPAHTDAKALGRETADAMGKLAADLRTFTAQSSTYPFMEQLGPVTEQLSKASEKSYDWFLTEFRSASEGLLDDKEQMIDPIRRFMVGGQRKIYVDAKSFLADQRENFVYAGRSGADDIQTVLSDPKCFRGDTLLNMKKQLAELKNVVSDALKKEIQTACEELEDCKAKISTARGFSDLSKANQDSLLNDVDAEISQTREANLIAMVRDRINTFKNTAYPALLARLDLLANPVPAPSDPMPEPTTSSGSTAVTDKPPAPVVSTHISIQRIKVPYSHAQLTNDGDVDDYVEALRKSLLEEIRNGKKVTV